MNVRIPIRRILVFVIFCGSSIPNQNLLHLSLHYRFCDGLVTDRFERNFFRATIADVGRDHELGSGRGDALRDGIGRETREYDRVHGSDPRAGQHHHRRLRNHGHVERHDVALLHAAGFERVGHARDIAQQLAKSEAADVVGFVSLVSDGDIVAATGLDVPIYAIIAGVDLAVEEPADVAILEGTVGYDRVGRKPRQKGPGSFVPIRPNIRNRFRVLRLVLFERQRAFKFLWLVHRLQIELRTMALRNGPKRGGGAATRSPRYRRDVGELRAGDRSRPERRGEGGRSKPLRHRLGGSEGMVRGPGLGRAKERGNEEERNNTSGREYHRSISLINI
mmetsp:Transcript_25519/g.58870  ORF Transcript_25519/g.58870 Transcript_25519/m.58870 type:complete len:335 (-) Transcript_25519:53-1057(-)